MNEAEWETWTANRARVLRYRQTHTSDGRNRRYQQHRRHGTLEAFDTGCRCPQCHTAHHNRNDIDL